MYILNQGKIQQLMDGGNVAPLDSELEIEDCIMTIAGIDKRISFLKRLKEDRVKNIDADIHKYESKREFIRSVILETLKVNNMKSLDFPGVGRVVSRNTKGKWVIEDEDALLGVFEKKLDADEFKKVVKTSKTLVKKEVDLVLDSMSKAGEEVPSSVKKEQDKTSLTVSIYDEKKIVDDIAVTDSLHDTTDLASTVDFDKITF